MENVTIEDGQLVIRVPMDTTRSNPYDEDYHPTMQNIIGLYEGEYRNGICYRIDMDYKGKDDEWSDYFYKCDLDRADFDAIMLRLGIDVVYDITDVNSDI
jgi:hypothetical protein